MTECFATENISLDFQTQLADEMKICPVLDDYREEQTNTEPDEMLDNIEKGFAAVPGEIFIEQEDSPEDVFGGAVTAGFLEEDSAVLTKRASFGVGTIGSFDVSSFRERSGHWVDQEGTEREQKERGC